MAKDRPRLDSGHRESWWVVHQHHQVDVVKTNEQPSSEVRTGERMKKVYGPFRSQQAAQDRADDIYSRTTKAMAERVGE